MTSKETIKCIKSFLPDEDCYSCSSCMYYTESACDMTKCYLKQAFEFLNQQTEPTLSECIKEWNEKGFDVDIYAVEIVIHNYRSVNKEEDGIEISIRLDMKTISYVNDVELSFDLHNLLTKTLKALEEMKDE